jgi:hypothetical protein
MEVPPVESNQFAHEPSAEPPASGLRIDIKKPDKRCPTGQQLEHSESKRRLLKNNAGLIQDFFRGNLAMKVLGVILNEAGQVLVRR